MPAAAAPLFSHPLRPTALPHLAVGFSVLSGMGLLLSQGRESRPGLGLALGGLGLMGASTCVLAALRSPHTLRLTEQGVELVSRLGTHRAPWGAVVAVVRAEPRREVEVAPYALQLEGDREAWLLPTADTAAPLRQWMEEVARRAGLVWVGHRALRPAEARRLAPGSLEAATAPHRRSTDPHT